MLLLYNHRSEILLLKRPPVGIWPNLWSLPECEAQQNPTDWCQQQFGLKSGEWQHWQNFQHTFSHFKLRIQPMVANIKKSATRVMDSHDTLWVKIHKDKKLAVATPVNKLLQQFSNWIKENK